MQNAPKSVSIVIPAFNEAPSIVGVIAELRAQLEGLSGIDWEIIVVDDASSDGTAEKISAISGISVLRHPQNRGYGASLKTGIHRAQGEYILTFDADGQHVPAEIPRLLDGAADYDLTVGARDANASPPQRRPGKAALALLMRLLMRAEIVDINCGLRLIRRKTILRYLHLCSNQFSFSMTSTIVMLGEGHFVRFVPVACRPRAGSTSQVGVMSGINAATAIIRTIMVLHPLRVLGPICTVLGVLFSVSLVYDIIANNDITDMTLLLMTFFLITLSAGLLADQIAHIRRELAGIRPISERLK